VLKFITAEQLAPRLSGIVIGPAGVGKTSLIRTIPKDEGVLVLSAEGGLLSVRDLIMSNQIQALEIGSFQDFEDALAILKTDQEYKDAFQWVFIDSLTEIDAMCLNVCEEKNGNNNYGVWGNYTKIMTKLIRDFRDLTDYNVFFTCLDLVDMDANKNRTFTCDLSSTKMKNKVPSFFDLSLYMQVGHTKGQAPGNNRIFYTDISSKRPGKGRSRNLDLIEPADLAYIRDKIFAAQTAGEPAKKE
jgi:hypothetical protein